MSDRLKRFLGRKKDETVEVLKIPVPDVELDIVNSMHQVMALTVSNVAKSYPKKFDMIKHIVTEYGFLIEQILVFRETGNPQELFNKLSEFVIRSVEGYLEKYEESEEIIDEEKGVKDLIMDGLIEIQEQIIKTEGIMPIVSLDGTVSSKPIEDWSKAPKITRRGGLPSVDMAIEDIKGIGEATAIQLREIGVDTLEKYVEYQKAQQNNEEKELKDDE